MNISYEHLIIKVMASTVSVAEPCKHEQTALHLPLHPERWRNISLLLTALGLMPVYGCLPMPLACLKSKGPFSHKGN